MILPPEVEELIASLRAEIAALRAEVAELKRRLGQDSSTSSKPPSSDGLAKKPRIAGSLREASGKPSGGQKGHKGDTLRRVADPDRIVQHEASQCRHCRALLAPGMARSLEARQVFDLADRPLIVTEHRALIYRCARCWGVTRAPFPDGVIGPAQYGGRIKAAAIYLNVQQLLPEDRAAQALSDLFGAPRLCPASLTAWVGRRALDLERVHARIGARLAETKVRHLDETGFRVAGKLHWLHTTSSQTLTFYRAEEKRGAIPLDLKCGVVVHDGFLPYGALRQVEHALCNAHHLRELKALIELDGEAWATPMRDTLLAANAAVRQARETGATALAPEQVEAFVESYWAAVREGLAFHRALPKLARDPQSRGRLKHRPGFNLLTRFKTFKDDVLRFLVDFDVPFTNNLAEQDIRMTKVKMKISGAFRTLAGAKTFACLRSIVSTARKQGCDILQILAATPDQITQALLA
jgi:transposase